MTAFKLTLMWDPEGGVLDLSSTRGQNLRMEASQKAGSSKCYNYTIKSQGYAERSFSSFSREVQEKYIGVYTISYLPSL